MTIFPEQTAGGVAVRNPDGTPANPVNVQNAYSPAPLFATSCPILALPSDCDARIEAKQINALVSEMLALAECLDPNGPWDCTALNNLCKAFQSWAATLDIQTLISVGDNPPDNPDVNQLWWESDTGNLFLYYNDGDTQQWVQIGGQPARPVADGTSIIGVGTLTDPYRVNRVDCGEY